MQKLSAFLSVSDVTTFAVNLGKALQDSGQDFATLGHTKRLHAIAKGMGYDNWQQYSAILTKQEFMNTMKTEYGLGEAYSDSAWFTLSDDSRGKPGADTARAYCKRFNIAPENFESVPLPDDIAKLCKWLVDNSSGSYRPSAQAADVIQDLLNMLNSDRRMNADQFFEEYEFDWEVKEVDGWEDTGSDRWTCNVFLEEDGDEPSIKKEFFVEFFPKSSMVRSHGISDGKVVSIPVVFTK